MAVEDVYEFQNWLQREMDARGWTNSRLARELGIFRGTISRWLADPKSGAFRRPSYENTKRMGEVFGVDTERLLYLIGWVSEDEIQISDAQRDCIKVIRMLPDDMLAIAHAQLYTLLDSHTQDDIRGAITKRTNTH